MALAMSAEAEQPPSMAPAPVTSSSEAPASAAPAAAPSAAAAPAQSKPEKPEALHASSAGAEEAEPSKKVCISAKLCMGVRACIPNHACYILFKPQNPVQCDCYTPCKVARHLGPVHETVSKNRAAGRCSGMHVTSQLRLEDIV